jgi:hypothetical protein
MIPPQTTTLAGIRRTPTRADCEASPKRSEGEGGRLHDLLGVCG